MLLIITSTDDELFINVNIDDLEWPWTLKILILCDFGGIFGCKKVNCDEIDEDRLRLPANRNCHKLSRVSWALSQISCFSRCAWRPINAKQTSTTCCWRIELLLKSAYLYSHLPRCLQCTACVLGGGWFAQSCLVSRNPTTLRHWVHQPWIPGRSRFNNSVGARKMFLSCYFLYVFVFYALQQNASRVLAIVQASVRLSATLVICIKTVQARITGSLPRATSTSLVFRDKISYP